MACASSPLTRNVGQCGRHSPHATHEDSSCSSRCRSRRTSRSCSSGRGSTWTASATATSASASTSGVTGTATSYQGAGYVWGGTTPSGWDCSGFVQYVYAQNGIDLPRTAAAQGAAGTPTSNPQPGDLVSQNGGSHVGIYLGNGQMVSALNPSQGTLVHSVNAMSVDGYYTR